MTIQMCKEDKVHKQHTYHTVHQNNKSTAHVLCTQTGQQCTINLSQSQGTTRVQSAVLKLQIGDYDRRAYLDGHTLHQTGA